MIEPYNVKHFHSLAQIREPARKLCEYLLAAGACDETAVMYALDRQENLRAKGYDPLIGMLLLDAGAITKKDLAHALKLQDIDRLANSSIFCSLPKSAISDIHSKSERLVYNSNEIIFRQKESSDFVYVILLGTVSLSHQPDKGKEIDLYALLTKSKEAVKASKSPQSSRQRSTNKLLPGNVNRLLSKGNSRS